LIVIHDLRLIPAMAQELRMFFPPLNSVILLFNPIEFLNFRIETESLLLKEFL